MAWSTRAATSGPSIGVSPPAAVPSAPSWPVGHTIFGIVYAVLTSRRPFDDLGPTSTAGTPTNVRRRLTRRLEAMGYLVTIAPPAA